jgi:glycosyltransferase involved in cell wall biosynthesis
MITVYTLTYNEEFMLPHFIRHYRSMFPGCRIIIYDNESTDETRNIAFANGCEIRINSTGGKLNDVRYLEIKNNCWKDAETDWVFVGDCDEHLNIDDNELKRQDRQGASFIRANGWNMVNMKDDMNFDGIVHGVRAKSYDKIYLFNRAMIRETNYSPGCHGANLVGKIHESSHTYELFHYKYVNPEFMVKRHAEFASRLSDVNIERGYGFHYRYSAEEIRGEFEEARKNAKLLITI